MMLFCIWEKYTLKKCPSDCQTRSESTEEDRGPRPMERHMYSLELLPVSKHSPSGNGQHLAVC
ncbi:hypothetical protein NC651_017800 [Populus alba x Populus x berolinensis]|nr:hypothetical protein NC651_017800 [Populus alba x Populus x berolinensis]